MSKAKKLVELGLNPETADFHYVRDPFAGVIGALLPKGEIAFEPGDIHCWSTGQLLELMPQTNKFHTTVNLELNRLVFEPIDDDVVVVDETTFHYADGKDLTEAAFNMMVWLLENKSQMLNFG